VLVLAPQITFPNRINFGIPVRGLAIHFLFLHFQPVMKNVLFPLFIVIFLASCANLNNMHKYELSNGAYHFRQGKSKYEKVSVFVKEDSVTIFPHANLTQPILPDPGKNQIFLKRTFDLDVMTIAFKYRPATTSLPRQLTTEFNGNVYLGYRFDRFIVKTEDTPVGKHKSFRHRGLTIGGFGGIGATSISPWTTNNKTIAEYNALILSRGIAAMVGLGNLTVGVGVGWDFITDKDKKIWIYQHKPWYGLTVGLNIN
jgi:hypothetical protein